MSKSKVKVAFVPVLHVGANVMIRTVTMIQTGRVEHLDDVWIHLVDCAWIAVTERFAETLRTGALLECEPGTRCQVGIGAVVDVWPWAAGVPLPREAQ